MRNSKSRAPLSKITFYYIWKNASEANAPSRPFGPAYPARTSSATDSAAAAELSAPARRCLASPKRPNAGAPHLAPATGHTRLRGRAAPSLTAEPVRARPRAASCGAHRHDATARGRRCSPPAPVPPAPEGRTIQQRGGTGMEQDDRLWPATRSHQN